MGFELKLIIFLLGLSFVVWVLYLLVKRRLNERNSLLWLAGALVILVIATVPAMVNRLAVLAGVDYPPTLLFLFATLVILLILLYQSIQISLLQEKCRELAQQLAITSFNQADRGFSPADREEVREERGSIV